jgi:hypothetical protein
MKAIAFSGGMDSTIMAYELFTTTQDNYYIFTIEDEHWPMNWAFNNVNFIMNKWFSNFKDRIIDHKIVLNARGYGNKYSLYAEYLQWAKAILKYDLTHLYSGTTKLYPGLEETEEYKGYAEGARVEFKEAFGKCYFHQPYFNFYRHQVANKYIEYNVVDMILDTQTCKSIALDGKLCNKSNCEDCSDRHEGLKRAFTNTKYEYIIEKDRNRKLKDVIWTKC